jgi:hypothetical protein
MAALPHWMVASFLSHLGMTYKNNIKTLLMTLPTVHRSAELLLLLLCFPVVIIITVYFRFIWDLFNDAVTSSDYILSHGNMVSDGCVRKWLWSNLRYYFGIFLEGLRNTTKPSVRITGIPAQIQTRHLLNSVTAWANLTGIITVICDHSINTLKPKIHLNNTLKFSTYLRETQCVSFTKTD